MSFLCFLFPFLVGLFVVLLTVFAHFVSLCGCLSPDCDTKRSHIGWSLVVLCTVASCFCFFVLSSRPTGQRTEEQETFMWLCSAVI